MLKFFLAIVHPVQFQREYEQFWNDPSKASILWIGLLFTILGLTMTLRQIIAMPMPTDANGQTILPQSLRVRTTQCLVLGKYSTAKAYGLEILVLHLQSTFIGLIDSNINIWFSMGIGIRLALRMGYHRDPKHYPLLSAFEGEMRRRIWSKINQIDTMMSFQLGLPSMIPSELCDTEPPSNLAFSDFSPDTQVLPPSRPLTDNTPVLFTIIKGKIMDVFKKIIAHTQSLSKFPIETTIILDMEMREAYNNLPANIKMVAISRSFTDSASTIMERCCIELLYLKGLVVLHRRFLSRDILDAKYAKFRQACLGAAMDILARHADLYQASQPGGQLYDDRWMISSLTTHDFLLAAMVVCLELSIHIRSNSRPRIPDFERQFDALQTSHMIWKSRYSESKETRIAARALEIMIRAVKGDEVDKALDNTSPPIDNPIFENQTQPYARPVTGMIDGSETLNWVSAWLRLKSNDIPQDAPSNILADITRSIFPRQQSHAGVHFFRYV